MTTTQAELLTPSTAQNERRWSYTSGISETPLLGLTIGDMFDQTVALYPVLRLKEQLSDLLPRWERYT